MCALLAGRFFATPLVVFFLLLDVRSIAKVPFLLVTRALGEGGALGAGEDDVRLVRPASGGSEVVFNTGASCACPPSGVDLPEEAGEEGREDAWWSTPTSGVTASP